MEHNPTVCESHTHIYIDVSKQVR